MSDDVIQCPHCGAEIEVPEGAEKIACWSCNGHIELVADEESGPPGPDSVVFDDDEWEVVDVRKERHLSLMLAAFACLAMGVGLWFAPSLAVWIYAPFFLLASILGAVALIPKRSAIGYVLLALALAIPGAIFGPKLLAQKRESPPAADPAWISPDTAKLNAEIEALQARKLRALSTEVRDRIRISAPKLQWRRGESSTDPIAAFQIVNYTRHQVSAVTLRAVITSPEGAAAAPLLDATFTHAFPEPLAPEGRLGVLAMPRELAALANTDISGRIDLTLELKLVNAADAAGRLLVEVFTDADEQVLEGLLNRRSHGPPAP